MSITFYRRRFLGAGLAVGVAALVPGAEAHEYFAPHFILIHPWTRASAPGATTAMVCMSFDEVTDSDRLIGASTPVAEAAEPVTPGTGGVSGIVIPKGVKTEFSETGAHLRLLRLKFPLELGREYPITFSFERSGLLRGSFLVDYEANT